jgi:membrane complex biogenesis BtpA family protein
MGRILDRARSDAEILSSAGFDAVLVENFADTPFHGSTVPPETVAAMSCAVASVVEASGVAVGVNVLRNDARAALAVATAAGAAFIRVNVHVGVMWTDQGTLEGRAAETLRVRAALAGDVALLADVHVKHATPPPGQTLEDAVADTWARGMADGLIVSGSGTGRPTDLANIGRARIGAPDAPVFVGSGVTPETVSNVLRVADGAIVGTCLKPGGDPGGAVDPAKARALMEAAGR